MNIESRTASWRNVRRFGLALARSALLAGLVIGLAPTTAEAATTKKGKSVSKKTEKIGKYWVDGSGNQLTPYDPDHQSVCQGAATINCKPSNAAGFSEFKETVYVYDPPAEYLLSGRLTISYNPADTVKAGWYGEFGADPSLPAPAVGGFTPSEAVGWLQAGANPALTTATITIDPMLGTVVFYFDWGSGGLLPTLNLDADGHFNFAGVVISSPLNAPAFPKASIVGNGLNLDTLGTSAPTYLLCTSGYCGLVPEPTNWAMLVAGFGLIGLVLRQGRRVRYRAQARL